MNCLWLTNHVPTMEQIKDLENQGYNVVEASNELKLLFASVPTGTNYEEFYKEFSEKLFIELGQDPKLHHWSLTFDALVIQGEMTTVFRVVSVLTGLRKPVKCLASLTERVSSETVIDGKTVKTSVFQHVGFREYINPCVF